MTITLSWVGLRYIQYLCPSVVSWTACAPWPAPPSSTSLAGSALSWTAVGTLWWGPPRPQASRCWGFSRRDGVQMWLFWTVWFCSLIRQVLRSLWTKAAEFRWVTQCAQQLCLNYFYVTFTEILNWLNKTLPSVVGNTFNWTLYYCLKTRAKKMEGNYSWGMLSFQIGFSSTR